MRRSTKAPDKPASPDELYQRAEMARWDLVRAARELLLLTRPDLIRRHLLGRVILEFDWPATPESDAPF